MSERPPIIDACGYVLPAAELLYERAAGPLRGYWPRLEERIALTAPTPGIGDWDSSYTRFVAASEMADAIAGTRRKPARFPRSPHARDDLEKRVLHDNPRGRLRALDRRGIGTQFLHPGAGLDVVIELDVVVAALLFGAYNRYVTTYCEADPRRLKAVLQLHAQEPEWSVQELRELAADASVVGVTIHFPAEVAPDQAELAPVWEAIAETGLPLIHRPGASAAIWDPPRFTRHLQDASIRRLGPNLRIAFVGWPQAALVAWARVPVGEASERIFFSAEMPFDTGTGVSLVLGSHFPFEEPGLFDQIALPRSGDPRGWAQLAENGQGLLSRISRR